MINGLTKFLVIIVSWNVREKLRRCLRALQTELDSGANAQIVVVDNNSVDGSVDMVRTEFSNARLVVNDKNLGFATACNQGARQGEPAEWLVFLNPDAAVKPGFFEALQQFISSHPKAEIIGGRIFNEGGSVQPSVRQLPSVWSLFLDLIKIKNLCPWLAKGYMMKDFNYNQAAPVEQVKGASMIVAKELWDCLQGFDEKFFVWFEEVDFCKRAKKCGAEIWYAPPVSVTHSGAASFKQLSYWRRHSLFTNSALAYTRKHHSILAYLFLWFFSRPWFIVAWLLDNLPKPQVKWWLAGLSIGLLEWWSYITFYNHGLGNISVAVLTIVWLVVAIKNLTAGVALLTTELILGSLGYWFSFDYAGDRLSLRLSLFLAALAVIAWRVVSKKSWRLAQSKIRYGYVLLLVVIGWGMAMGWWRGQNWGDLFLDMNGYLYLLLFPLFYEVGFELLQPRWLKWWGVVLLTQSLKTMALTYYFTNLPANLLTVYNNLPIYHWLRDTGWGQVARLGSRSFRVFSQAHVYSSLAGIGITIYLTRQVGNLFSNIKKQKFIYIVWLSVAVTLLLSGSRSFYVGVLLVLLTSILIIIARRQGEALKNLLINILFIGFVALAVVWLVRLSSQERLGNNPAEQFSVRQAAISSRFELWRPLWREIFKHPVVGSGWGASVTYKSYDPHLVSRTAGGSGEYRTTALEWGYLDLWYKLGLPGALIYVLFFVICIGWPFWRKVKKYNLILPTVVVSVVVVLFVIHLTTPYLNHPLGLGVLMIAISYFGSLKFKTSL